MLLSIVNYFFGSNHYYSSYMVSRQMNVSFADNQDGNIKREARPDVHDTFSRHICIIFGHICMKNYHYQTYSLYGDQHRCLIYRFENYFLGTVIYNVLQLMAYNDSVNFS